MELKIFGRTIEHTLSLHSIPAHMGVLAAVKNKQLWRDAKVSDYNNGREHGYYLVYANKVVAFAEFRNSDSIVVYCGSEGDFVNGYPSEAVYEHKTFFACGAFKAAAKFITAYLLE